MRCLGYPELWERGVPSACDLVVTAATVEGELKITSQVRLPVVMR
jgi:hypothetical protein